MVYCSCGRIAVGVYLSQDSIEMSLCDVI